MPFLHIMFMDVTQPIFQGEGRFVFDCGAVLPPLEPSAGHALGDFTVAILLSARKAHKA